ncbi:MAG: hypothetical protein NTW56_09845 [Alphaproteobacteria bacterium]|nr:hypothetical protein [Alphaproteobacteria bacterium]
MNGVRVGIAGYEAMKALTLRIARGEEKPGADEPKVWCVSEEAAGKPGLMRVLVERGLVGDTPPVEPNAA